MLCRSDSKGLFRATTEIGIADFYGILGEFVYAAALLAFRGRIVSLTSEHAYELLYYPSTIVVAAPVVPKRRMLFLIVRIKNTHFSYHLSSPLQQ